MNGWQAQVPHAEQETMRSRALNEIYALMRLADPSMPKQEQQDLCRKAEAQIWQKAKSADDYRKRVESKCAKLRLVTNAQATPPASAPAAAAAAAAPAAPPPIQPPQQRIRPSAPVPQVAGDYPPPQQQQPLPQQQPAVAAVAVAYGVTAGGGHPHHHHHQQQQQQWPPPQRPAAPVPASAPVPAALAQKRKLEQTQAPPPHHAPQATAVRSQQQAYGVVAPAAAAAAAGGGVAPLPPDAKRARVDAGPSAAAASAATTVVPQGAGAVQPVHQAPRPLAPPPLPASQAQAQQQQAQQQQQQQQQQAQRQQQQAAAALRAADLIAPHLESFRFFLAHYQEYRTPDTPVEKFMGWHKFITRVVNSDSLESTGGIAFQPRLAEALSRAAAFLQGWRKGYEELKASQQQQQQQQQQSPFLEQRRLDAELASPAAAAAASFSGREQQQQPLYDWDGLKRQVVQTVKEGSDAKRLATLTHAPALARAALAARGLPTEEEDDDEETATTSTTVRLRRTFNAAMARLAATAAAAGAATENGDGGGGSAGSGAGALGDGVLGALELLKKADLLLQDLRAEAPPPVAGFPSSSNASRQQQQIQMLQQQQQQQQQQIQRVDAAGRADAPTVAWFYRRLEERGGGDAPLPPATVDAEGPWLRGLQSPHPGGGVADAPELASLLSARFTAAHGYRLRCPDPRTLRVSYDPQAHSSSSSGSSASFPSHAPYGAAPWTAEVILGRKRYARAASPATLWPVSVRVAVEGNEGSSWSRRLTEEAASALLAWKARTRGDDAVRAAAAVLAEVGSRARVARCALTGSALRPDAIGGGGAAAMEVVPPTYHCPATGRLTCHLQTPPPSSLEALLMSHSPSPPASP